MFNVSLGVLGTRVCLWSRKERYAAIWLLPAIVFASLTLVACGSLGAAGDRTEKDRAGSQKSEAAALTRCPKLGNDDPLVQDAITYADDQDLPAEEAMRRLRLQECYADDLAELEQRLRNNEGNTFAGLWIQQAPEYRFIVIFTENGERTMRPYVEGEPFADLLEVRSGARATFAQLHDAQEKAMRVVDGLDMVAGSGVNLRKNRAEVYVTDRAQLEAALRKADARLPEYVAVVERKKIDVPT